jgi:hypothetical protein
MPIERRIYRDESIGFQFTYPQKVNGKPVMEPIPEERKAGRNDLFKSEWFEVSFSLTNLTDNPNKFAIKIDGVYPCEGYFYSIEQNEWHEYECAPPYKAVGPIETLSWDELFSYLENNASKSALPIIETESGRVAFPYTIFSYGGEGAGYRVFDLERRLFFEISYFHADYNSPEFIKEKERVKEFLQDTVRTVNFFNLNNSL